MLPVHAPQVGQLQVQLPPPEVEVLEGVQACGLGVELVAGVGEGQQGGLRPETQHQHAPRPSIRRQVLQIHGMGLRRSSRGLNGRAPQGVA